MNMLKLPINLYPPFFKDKLCATRGYLDTGGNVQEFIKVVLEAIEIFNRSGMTSMKIIIFCHTPYERYEVAELLRQCGITVSYDMVPGSDNALFTFDWK